MALKLAEAAVDAVKTFLLSQLPTALAAVQADVGDGLVCEDVKEWIVGERHSADYPAGWLLVPSSRPVPFDQDENRDSHGGQFPLGMWDHTLEVIVAAVDPDDPERLRTRLYRYVRALAEVFRAHETYEPGVAEWIRARVVGHDYARVFQHVDSTMFRQDAHVLVQITRVD